MLTFWVVAPVVFATIANLFGILIKLELELGRRIVRSASKLAQAIESTEAL